RARKPARSRTSPASIRLTSAAKPPKWSFIPASRAPKPLHSACSSSCGRARSFPDRWSREAWMAEVTCRVADGVAVLEIRQPPVNALSHDVRRQLQDHLTRLAGDLQGGGIVLAGTDR